MLWCYNFLVCNAYYALPEPYFPDRTTKHWNVVARVLIYMKSMEDWISRVRSVARQRRLTAHGPWLTLAVVVVRSQVLRLTWNTITQIITLTLAVVIVSLLLITQIQKYNHTNKNPCSCSCLVRSQVLRLTWNRVWEPDQEVHHWISLYCWSPQIHKYANTSQILLAVLGVRWSADFPSFSLPAVFTRSLLVLPLFWLTLITTSINWGRLHQNVQGWCKLVRLY